MAPRTRTVRASAPPPGAQAGRDAGAAPPLGRACTGGAAVDGVQSCEAEADRDGGAAPNDDLAEKAMRPSDTLNAIIDGFAGAGAAG